MGEVTRLMILGHVATRSWLKAGSALVIALFAASACSDPKESDAKTDGGASESGSDSVLRTLDPSITEWANSAAEAYAKQAAAGSALDYGHVAQEIKPITQKLSQAICDVLKGSDSQKEAELRDTILFSTDEAFARAFAQKPNLLVATGMSTWGDWPPFMLKDPPPAATALVEGPQSLPQFVKADFIGSGGGLIIPKQTDPSYEDFRKWFYEPSLDNKLLERSTVTSLEIRSSADACPE